MLKPTNDTDDETNKPWQVAGSVRAPTATSRLVGTDGGEQRAWRGGARDGEMEASAAGEAGDEECCSDAVGQE